MCRLYVHISPKANHNTRQPICKVSLVVKSTARAASSLSRRLAVSLSVFSSPADSGHPRLSRAARYFGWQKNKRQPQTWLPLFILTAARTQYGLSMVGANGLEPPLPFSLRLGARGFELCQMVATCLRPASNGHYSNFGRFCKRQIDYNWWCFTGVSITWNDLLIDNC